MEITPQKIVLISSGQPSLNPRLVKEADALAEAGYLVTILYAYWNDWGTAFDELLLPSKKWKAIRIGGHPQQEPFTFFISRLIHKMAKLGLNIFGPEYFASYAIARSSYFLLRAAKKYQAELYIGHNLGALPAVIKAAKKNNRPCGFDAEDFYRNDQSDSPTHKDVVLKTYLEDKYLPQVDYLSASSPQIAEAYHQLYADKKLVTLLNVFPLSEKIQPASSSKSGTIKLFWFSQTIGHGRGLEDILAAINLLNDLSLELHLLGHCSKGYKEDLSNRSNAVYFHEPVPSDQLVHFASQFDIGIAAEKTTPYNRDICLTNKIFTYMQAGLAIIGSNTIAQQSLLNQHPAIGMTYENRNLRSLVTALRHYLQHRDQLTLARHAALKLAREKYNWEQESLIFLETVSKLLHTS